MGLDDWPVTRNPETDERMAHRWKDHWQACFNTWCGIEMDPKSYERLGNRVTDVSWCPTCWVPVGETS